MIQLPLIVAYCAVWAFLIYWGTRAERRFFDELDKRTHTQLSVDAELDAVTMNPVAALATTPRRTAKRLRAIAEPQTDPDLERLRQECLRRRLVRMIFFFGGTALLIASVFVQWP